MNRARSLLHSMKPSFPRLVGSAPSARALALAVLFETHEGEAFAQELLDRHLSRTPLSPVDRRLATQLVYGVLRRRGTLDALLRPAITRPPHQVERWLWDLLRLGAYQLALLTHIPAHAALHETVELAAIFGRPGAKGFVNGVLRSSSRLLTEEFVDAAAADALPMEAGRYRRLNRPVLPDPAANPVEYLSAGMSLPSWLAERWLGRFGWEEALRFGFWFAGPAPLWLRSNHLRIERDALILALREAGVGAEAGGHPQAIRLTEHASIRELPGYEQGWFAVQDESAMKVASALAPEPGSRVLDLCSAPGGKATHLADLMRNQGQIIACDVDEARLRTVRELCNRLGVSIVETLSVSESEPPPGPFDAVLVDVPCSNTGVLGRRPEARWRLKPDDFRRLVPLQTGLLTLAAERVRPGGAIVYSTCSIEPEENRQIVQNVLRRSPELTLEAEEEQLPGRPADGGYWARLRRQSS